MRNLFLAAAVLFAFGVTSCKKDYTCECTYLGDPEMHELKDFKKKDAEDACDLIETANQVFDPASTCELN